MFTSLNNVQLQVRFAEGELAGRVCPVIGWDHLDEDNPEPVVLLPGGSFKAAVDVACYDLEPVEPAPAVAYPPFPTVAHWDTPNVWSAPLLWWQWDGADGLWVAVVLTEDGPSLADGTHVLPPDRIDPA